MPPVSTFPPAPTSYPAPTYEQPLDGAARYRSPGGLAVWVTVSLIMGIFVDLGSIVSNLLQASLLTDVQNGIGASQETLEANDARQALFGLTQFAVYLLTTVLFLIWNSRVYRNLEALSRWRLLHGPGWAVGAWFVPFLNLLRPYQIMRETLWVSSHPDLADDAPTAYTPPGTALLGFWWAGYLAMGILGQIAFRVALSAKGAGELQTSSYLGAAADVVSVGAAILAVAVVGLISSRQQTAARVRGVPLNA
jgi:hypothetical protein